MSKIINTIIHATSGLLFIIIGIIYIIRNYTVYTLSFKLLGILTLISSLLKLINLILKRKKVLTNILDIFLNTILGILFINKPNLFIYLSTKIFSMYALIQSLCGFINLIIYKQDKLKGKIYILTTSTLSLMLSITLMFSKDTNSIYICYIIGLYLILYGITIISSSILTKTKIVLPLPIIFTMFLPNILIKRILKGINPKKINNNQDQDLEILIHLSKTGSASLGHVEFAFEDKVYSYACYNYLNRRLFGGIGDGIFGIFDKKAYLKYCICEKNRFILSYGVKLTNKEKENIIKEIDKLISTNTEIWYPEIKYYEDGLIEKKDFNEMANKIYKHANGKFYRFTKGKYKTFFVLRTNCATCVDNIFNAIGTKIINLEGIISPGTYYSYLEKEYHKKNSKIISKTLYTKELIEKLNYKYVKRK